MVEHPGEQHVRLFTGDEIERTPTAYVEEDRSTTLLDAVVAKAAQVAEVRGMRAHQVWLPPLPARIPLPQLAQTDGALGLIDEPFKQRQTPFHLNLDTAGGHVAIAGGPQTVSYTHLTLPTTLHECRSRWSPYH